MPFKSKAQMKACFASHGFNGKVNCDEWAKATNDIKSLPDKMGKGGINMLRPKNCKKCGGRMSMMQAGGLQLYNQSNTPQGAITPTGQSSLAKLTPQQIQQLASQYGFRTDTNENLQQDLFGYALKNQPAAYQKVMDKYGQTNAGSVLDGILGARTAELLQSLPPPSQTPAAPFQQPAKLTENLYSGDKRLLGMASQKYRDSQGITDPGVVAPEYVDYQQFTPNTANLSGPRYKIPYDTYLNQLTRGTTTMQNPDEVAPYMILPDAAKQAILSRSNGSTVAGKMKGGRLIMQGGGGMPRQKDYPDYESWQQAMDSWQSQNQQQSTPDYRIGMMSGDTSLVPPDQQLQQQQPNFAQNAINQGVIRDPSYYANGGPGMTTQNPQRKKSNPYQNLQNIGLGLMAARTGLGEIAGRVERGRQNQYDYMQQTALGQMNPMPTNDFQPNPYNLYMQMGGNLNHILRDYTDHYSNNAQFDFGSGDDDEGDMDEHHIMTPGRMNMDLPEMAKGGYEIDRMLVVRNVLPKLLKLGQLGTSKYRNYKRGGLSRSNDYGNANHPYPSVDASDFAGPDRSYPIPTKADAIDALRLAHLHGRSDVIAKIHQKYPDLAYGGYPQYQLGGQLDEYKSGGNWIQGAINPSHKGWCTPLSNPHCTGARRRLALTFKKHHGFHKKK